MSEILYTLQCYLQVFKYMTFVNVFSIYVLMSNRIEMFSKIYIGACIVLVIFVFVDWSYQLLDKQSYQTQD